MNHISKIFLDALEHNNKNEEKNKTRRQKQRIAQQKSRGRKNEANKK